MHMRILHQFEIGKGTFANVWSQAKPLNPVIWNIMNV